MTEIPAVVGSLSPSRAADFKTCPLLYRFRAVDRIAEKPSPAAARGTLVHGVLEKVFDLPRAERTLRAATSLIQPTWDELRAAEPAIAQMFAGDDGEDLTLWLESAQKLVGRYFELEDPTRFDPTGRELLVESVLEGGLLLRGYIDRVDTAPDGRVRVVDYKTGAAPREAFEAKALFQMKFYALVLWLSTGQVPAQLKLMYLADRDELTYSPDERELRALQRQLHALWTAIERSLAAKEFRPSPSRLCGWCDHKERCPAFGGTLPPFPEVTSNAMSMDRRTEQRATEA